MFRLFVGSKHVAPKKYKLIEILKDKNSIRQTHRLLFIAWGLHVSTLCRVETCSPRTINNVFDVYYFCLLIFELFGYQAAYILLHFRVKCAKFHDCPLMSHHQFVRNLSTVKEISWNVFKQGAWKCASWQPLISLERLRKVLYVPRFVAGCILASRG